MSSSEDEDIPASQAQSSTFIVDSVLRTMLSNSSASSSTHPTLSQSSSTPLFASYRQANLEANKGLRGKARSSKSMGVTSMPTLIHLLFAPTSLLPTPTYLLFAPTHLLPTLTYLLLAPTYLLFAPTHLLPTPMYLLLAPTYLLLTPTFLLQTPTLFLQSVRPASVIPSGTYPVSFLSLTCHPVATYSFHVFLLLRLSHVLCLSQGSCPFS